ncbi:MAG: bifunctional aspartate kinase/homoserine dehydrogenase I, partial [Bacteroidia bacterium]|nr:bifunctional aspartate kinase/homoserine dehydrogenase I [Bacteroidia bacterium]
MKILKFGGSSVATPERIKSVIDIVKSEKSDIAVVFSAFGGITDELIRLSELALSGDLNYKTLLAQVERRHLDAVRALIGVQAQSSILASVKYTMNELEDVLHGVFLVKERTARTLDYIMSFGERLSAYIIAEAFKASGVDAAFLDARVLVRTDNQFGNARVNFAVTNAAMRQHFAESKSLQIVTGFIGTAETGETTTLGRSGSDYTAAILAGALSATDLEIWTDVDGMMTADPRRVKKAFTVPQLSYEEAMELSHFGAKVVFPATMQPAMANKIPIWIRNTFNPSFTGTVIRAASTNGKLIKGISSMNHISLLSVQGSGLVGVVGISMRLFGTLARERINVILISQASSEHSICFGIESSHAAKAKAAIEKEFQYEIRNEEMDHVLIEDELAIVAVVGEGMKHNPGTSGRMFNSLGRNGVNVSAIAQGSSELNISAVIKQADVGKALNALHEAFFLSDKKVLNLFLVGVGLIGKELMKMMDEQYVKLSEENLLEMNVVAVANSKKMLFAEDGIAFTNGIEQLQREGEPMEMSAFVERMNSLNMPNSIFIDCTASEEVTNYYASILAANISIVTPNKRANSGTLEKYKHLRTTAFKRGVRFFYETNVGAGLPVINTLNDLLLSGDKVRRIEAVLSGTLNFIFSSFAPGMRFSHVVKEAREKGYTEPDPRDDLNGMDVARKILILARETGVALELGDVNVENLVPEPMRNLGVDQFMDALP